MGARRVLLGLALALVSCRSCEDPPPAPDYADPASWAALPERSDAADGVPDGAGLERGARALLRDGQATARVDVFFVHPTTLVDSLTIENARLGDHALDAATDEAIKAQATAFNGAGRVFAPRYRQASAVSFATERGAAAIDLAARDVDAAFEAYLRRSPGRPFVLAGHSQGSTHLIRLLRARIDGQALAARLVAAYLVGELVGDDAFAHLRPCASARATGCYVSWATLRDGARPAGACGSRQLSPCNAASANTARVPVVCVNPLTWTVGGAGAAALNLGAGPGFGGDPEAFGGLVPRFVDARCDAQGLLRVTDDVDLGGFTARERASTEAGDYHEYDINLFYLNLRRNVAERVAAFDAR